ncbi:MAG TPA: aminotransferase class I/II-fold pyridoxal phosphate-dependent enzyme [Longimicrobium sp.]|nr:aminotransferase class I/II-fold pyridoxal phosphate-dependent enzyme [Longimicrobium sp.]
MGGGQLLGSGGAHQRPQGGNPPVLAAAAAGLHAGGGVLSGDPGPGQERAPVYEAMLEYQRRGVVPLHTPGHKGVAGPPGLERWLTPLGLACDLPSMDATDYWFHPQGCIARAQELAARLYGAAETFYLVNGSTIGVQAMLLAALAPGEQVLLPRYLHLSAFSGLVLSGAVPVYLHTRWLEPAGPVPPTAEEVEAQLRLHPEVRAVFLTHPTYYGVGRPLAPVAEVCRRHDVALLVDEAHGAHLRFLPGSPLPSALESGADVVVQSVHKTVGSLVGTAQMHRGRGGRVTAERLQAALNLLQSTSSSYLLLASLDLARRWMWAEGEARFGRAAGAAAALAGALDAAGGAVALRASRHPELAGCAQDPLRMVVDVAGLGMSGFEVERRLLQEFGLLDEFCDARNVALVLGPQDAPETYERLAAAFRSLAASRPTAALPPDDRLRTAPAPPLVLTPREAAYRPRAPVPLTEALGRVCGEMITMYPPGIPLVCPGEEVTAEVVDHCRALAAQRACVFAEDPALATVTVLTD